MHQLEDHLLGVAPGEIGQREQQRPSAEQADIGHGEGREMYHDIGLEGLEASHTPGAGLEVGGVGIMDGVGRSLLEEHREPVAREGGHRLGG